MRHPKEATSRQGHEPVWHPSPYATGQIAQRRRRRGNSTASGGPIGVSAKPASLFVPVGLVAQPQQSLTKPLAFIAEKEGEENGLSFH